MRLAINVIVPLQRGNKTPKINERMKNQPNRELFSRTPASVRFFFDEFACVGDTRIEAKNRSSHRTIRRELSRQFFHDRVSKRDSEARSTGPGRDVFQRGELENARQPPHDAAKFSKERSFGKSRRGCSRNAWI